MSHSDSPLVPGEATHSGTIDKRDKIYGPYSVNSDLCQAIKDLFRRRPGYAALLPSERESLDMIFHKVSRIVVGAEAGAPPPARVDSWHDIVGYAKLAEDRVKDGNPF